MQTITFSDELRRAMLQAVADEFGIPVSELDSMSRKRHLVVLRYAIGYLFCVRNKMTWVECGEFMRRDRTTMSTGVKMWGGLFLTPEGSKMVDRVERAMLSAVEKASPTLGRSYD